MPEINKAVYSKTTKSDRQKGTKRERCASSAPWPLSRSMTRPRPHLFSHSARQRQQARQAEDPQQETLVARAAWATCACAGARGGRRCPARSTAKHAARTSAKATKTTRHEDAQHEKENSQIGEYLIPEVRPPAAARKATCTRQADHAREAATQTSTANRMRARTLRSG
jgi:hypothetical protein